MKLNPIISKLIVASAILLSSATLSQAQQRPSGVSSLGEQTCEAMQGGRYVVIDKTYAIGFEVFNAVARLGMDGSIWNYVTYVSNDTPTKVACRLGNSRSQSPYKNLTLAFGIPENVKLAEYNRTTRLSIYLDGEFYDYQDVVPGDKYLMSIDIENVRSVGLEASCLSNKGCSGIYFFEDILE